MLPDVPTVAETLPGYEATVSGTAFRARRHAERTHRVSERANHRAMTLPEVRKRMDDIGVEIVNQNPEQFSAAMRRDTATWTS